jgi:cytochrome c oxidase cbb3-type subunit I/II
VNSIEIPVAAFNSYPIWGGIQDALVQWWYGHNAVAFFLTTPFLGLMYYYLPKAANRPVFSYRLSIIHFWALVFIYIWAGPHHLLYTALPDWAQTLGVVFSIMLWAPSWGGMINGLLTLRGAWHLVRTDPVIKFMVAALTFYGMATFEGPLLSIKSVSALAHYTDWIIAHVHGGALGWNGFLTFSMIYYLVPRLWKTPLYSVKLANAHFWIGLLGILLYYTSMVAAGFTQGAMWMAMDKGQLVYPDFVETVVRIVPLYAVRALGGGFFILGFFIMVYNIVQTLRNAPKPSDETVIAPARLWKKEHEGEGHRRLEGMATVFSVLAFLAIFVGSAIEIYPTLSIQRYVKPTTTVSPYTPLELGGRDLYIREGCYTCHSQMIRKLDFDVVRYGKPSTIEESMYDRPFQWGSRRIGPDLARVGSKYPDLWHLRHMVDPRAVTPKSIMPSYPWLLEKKTDFLGLRKRVSVLRFLGVPYSDEEVSQADRLAEKQAKTIADGLVAQGGPPGLENKEIVAMIAYLQALGQKGGSDE